MVEIQTKATVLRNQLVHRLLILLTFLGLLSCGTKSDTSFKFVHLDAERTGVDFSNTITENDSINLFDYYYIYNGSGVAVGDLNNDDLPDLFFGGNMVGSELYLNQGSLSFQKITQQAGLKTTSWIMGVNLVDINADRLLDIYLCVAGPTKDVKARRNLLFVNQGIDSDGIPHFEEAAAAYGLDDHSFSVQSAFFDYDRDGDLDVFVLTNRVDQIDKTYIVQNGVSLTNGETIDHLYENMGYQPHLGHPFYERKDTSFGIATEGYGLGVAIDDLNSDGWPDIFVANDFMPNDFIYLNQSDGTFKEMGKDFLPTQTYNGMGVDIADVNNDLLPDIMVLDMLPDNNDRRKSMIAGMETQKFRMRMEAGYQPQYIRNTLQLNRGTNSKGRPYFSDIGQLSGVHATDWSWGPLFADFDNDGDRDIFITNGFVKDMTDLDYINFRASKSYFGTKEAKVERTKKLMDALVEVKIPNFLYRNEGNLAFSDVSKSSGIAIPSFSNGAIFADLDDDGDLDIVTNDINSNALLFENKLNDGASYLKIKLKGSDLNTMALGTKIYIDTGERQLYNFVSPTRGYLSNISSGIHVGLGKDTLVEEIKINWPDGKQQLLYNIPTNQVIEITYQKTDEIASNTPSLSTPHYEVIDSPIKYLSAENDYNDFDRDPLLLMRYSRQGPCLSVGNIDQSGGDDLFIGGSTGNAPVLFMQNESGQFQKKTFIPGEEIYEDVASTLFDYDGDGDLDLYVVSGGIEFEENAPQYQDRLYINDGSGNFQRSDRLPLMNSSGSCVTISDFDKDGDLDLFVGGRVSPGSYPTPPRSYLLVNEAGRYVDRSNDVAGLSNIGMVSDALWDDYNNDGWDDLLLVGEWMPFTIYNNRNGTLEKLEHSSFNHTKGLWNVLEAIDLDGDGDNDYIAGNQGMNQDFKASPQKPLKLYADDFDQNGKIDPILAHFMKDKVDGKEKLFPFHGMDDLFKQVVGFRKLFQSYQQFSEAPFDQVLTDKMLQNAQVFEAQTLASTYFINLGNGRFDPVELPKEAQLAPIRAITTEDFNDDGRIDLIVAGNNNNSENTYGSYNTALGMALLHTDGRQWQPIPPWQSGLFLNQDIRSFTKIKTVNQEELLLIGVNDAKPICLKKTKN